MPLTPNQQKAVQSAHEPLFIQAGAGTGKTFTLTKRIAHGLSQESGPLIGAVNRLLTITFTEKAAAELIGRVRAELRAQNLSEESLQIDAAWISTIHAMCRRMLLAHAFEIGLDSGSNMLSEDESRALSDMALDWLLQNDAESHELQMLIKQFGIEEAAALIGEVSKLLVLAPNGAQDFNLGPKPPSMRAAAKQIQRVIAFYQQALVDLELEGMPTDKPTYVENADILHTAIEKLQILAASVQEDFNWQHILAKLEEIKPPTGKVRKDPFKTIFYECKVALIELKAQAISAQSYELLNAVITLSTLHLEQHQQLKRELGALDTNDLLIQAYRLLEQNDEVATAYQNQFDSIMVDEFQDTDNLQVGIVGRVCDPNLTHLATVGDAQQSIYGFRGADLEVYQSMRASMQAHGSKEVELTTNYRSQPDILRFVEDIFSTPEFFGTSFLKVGSGRDAQDAPNWLAAEEPRVKVLLSAGTKQEGSRSSTSTDSLRKADAIALADEFERLHQQGASYGDMAILMQSTKSTYAGACLQELRSRGIPCVISGGSDFFTQPEVSIVAMILRVIANQDDDEALFNLLGSNVFNANDDDLLTLALLAKDKLKLKPEELRTKPSLFDALREYVANQDEAKSEALCAAYRVLEQVSQASTHMPISQLVSWVVKLSGWEASLAQLGVEGGAVYANIERACDMLADYEALHGHAPIAASSYFNNLVDIAHEGTGARSKLGTLVSTGSNAVQIMTIHSSKGLEFPIVAVAEFEKSSFNRGAQLISLSEGGNRYLALGASTQSGFSDYMESQEESASFEKTADSSSFLAYATLLKKQREQQEQQRLLYVALTRARDMLIFVTHDKTFGSKGELSQGLTSDALHAVFGEQLPAGNGVFRTGAGALVDLQIQTVPYQEDTQDAQAEQLQSSVVTHSYPTSLEIPQISAQAYANPQIYSYSSIAKRNKQQDEPPVAQAIQLRNRELDQETVSVVGSAFHLLAQWLAMQTMVNEQELAQRVRAVVVRYQLTEEESNRLAHALAAWVSSPRYEMTQTYQQRYAEYAFCVDVEGYALEGFIDLACFDDAGNALVIDYKTGTSGQEDELQERYALQAYCYAYALLSSGECSHVELVFVRPEVNMQEVVFTFTKDDLPALIQAILGSAQ